ncbi:LamG domain-containing protein [Chitinophaga japonensis]|uniref:Glycosyl hydrolase family 16 n=1 Tax=Chitinophaga japonensis TaxID=104662 RepID=A0A562SSI3_CHIJA|nr:family 16 glycosylhydrolase [Chitinophaga japonensis]TWI83984.1 glycosyl hydrolase family 16 [Chitinophaga japonensis]
MRTLFNTLLVCTPLFICSCAKQAQQEQLQQAPLQASASQSAVMAAATWETVIDGNSFNSYSAFEAAWNYLYPWGSDHNGTARMYGSPTDHNHIYLSNGVLTEKATRINWDEGNSSADPYLPIRYHSGAVHAKTHVLVNDQFPNWEVKCDFQAPSVKGSWPAFWLTGVNSWPPESDIMEFKGDANNWQNTFRTPSDVSSTITWVSSPGNWHTYRVWITKVNDTDVDIHYYIDGNWKAVHRGNFVGKPFYVIINLQMEGSSGSPGPSADTYLHARNVYIGRTRNY